MLEGAGVPVEIVPADIDERAIEETVRDHSEFTGSNIGHGMALHLASKKAQAVMEQRTGRYIVGADQTLLLDDRLFHKPTDRASARAQLSELRGRTHELHSAVAVAQDDGHERKVWIPGTTVARMTMRDFSDAFLEAYLDEVGAAAQTSVGGYQVEGRGIQLFEKIEGDHFTILGLPLVPLLDFLRQMKLLSE
jgi:septum formation protein